MLQDKPECFSHVDSGYWYEVTNHIGKSYAYFGVEIFGDKAFVHFHMLDKWTPGKMKQALRDWEMLKGLMKGKGCSLIVVSNYNTEDKAWMKMIQHFGFPDPGVITIAISQQRIE